MRRDLTIPEMRMHSKLWLLAQNQKSRQAQLTAFLLTSGWRRGTEMHSWMAPAFTRCLDDRLSRPELGYCVADAKTQNTFGVEGLKRAIIYANDDGKAHCWFVARRDIQPGDEITCDYNVNITGGTAWPCHCGAARCRGTTVGDFFLLPPEIQREYRPLLADWFVRRHAAALRRLQGER